MVYSGTVSGGIPGLKSNPMGKVFLSMAARLNALSELEPPVLKAAAAPPQPNLPGLGSGLLDYGAAVEKEGPYFAPTTDLHAASGMN